MVGSDTIVIIRYMTMKVMLAPKYKAPGNIYQALCRQKTIKHRFLVLQDLLENMATHSLVDFTVGSCQGFCVTPRSFKRLRNSTNSLGVIFCFGSPSLGGRISS
ncbi:Uncharacterised protein [Salmonella enterica subsp. enterica]|uniref:Uncharacterized protein n=4 Tax=Salmonella enterica I TaxID=59201 RepID=A0A379WQ75_SALET|nr:Uncharacterised protein [Salmonella enterica subsp. enterica]